MLPVFTWARYILKNTLLNKNYIAESRLKKTIIEDSKGYVNGIVLDVGCGTKPYYDGLVRNGRIKKYYGLEYPGAENWDGKKIKNVEIFGDGQNLPIASNAVDTVISISVIGFVPEPYEFLSEVWRVLKPGGILFMTAPSTFLLLKGGHYFRFTEKGLKYLLNKRGFDTITIKGHCNTIATIGQLLSTYVAEALIAHHQTKQANPLKAALFLPLCGLIQGLSLIVEYFTHSKSLTVAYTVVAKK